VTISDLLNRLGSPEEYVRRVLQTMYEQRGTHGEVSVRIGITGNGHAPNYRVDNADTEEPIEAFDGASGNAFTDYASVPVNVSRLGGGFKRLIVAILPLLLPLIVALLSLFPCCYSAVPPLLLPLIKR
jgi:hypothetical protein